jgi:hypothetical protein
MAVGDRGKAPNKTGTQPRKRVDAPAPKPGRKSVKSGAGRGAGHPKHAATRSAGLKTSETRGPGRRRDPPTSRPGQLSRSTASRHERHTWFQVRICDESSPRATDQLIGGRVVGRCDT